MVWSPEEYAKAAVVAQEANEEMLGRLEWMTVQPKVIVDIGCGLANSSTQLQARFPEAQVLALDLSEQMLAYQAHSPKLCSNTLQLPLRHQSVDMVFANFLLPWQMDLVGTLKEWQRVLIPNGLLMLTALGPDTLKECHQQQTLVPGLMDMHDLGDLLVQQHFADPVLDINYYTVTYQTEQQLLDELVTTGMIASPVNPIPLPCLTATYEIIYAHAWHHPPVGFRADAGGIARIPISSLRTKTPPSF